MRKRRRPAPSACATSAAAWGWRGSRRDSGAAVRLWALALPPCCLAALLVDAFPCLDGGYSAAQGWAAVRAAVVGFRRSAWGGAASPPGFQLSSADPGGDPAVVTT